MNKCPKCLSLLSDSAKVCDQCGAETGFENRQTKPALSIDMSEATKILGEGEMTPEKWKKIKEVFEKAQELPADKREHFLGSECGNDDELRNEVEVLLSSFEIEDAFLEELAVAEVASMLGTERKAGSESGRFESGTIIDSRYEILNLLGKGGMGEVYLANDSNLDRKVALKVLPSDLTESKSRLQRFEQEARAVSALNHPHILTIFEFGETKDGVHFLASEFVEGKTLNEHGSYEDLSLSRVLDIAMQVTSALAAAHEAGITHRDIKPDNIMVRHDGYIKVLDFGLAKLSESGQAGDADSEATTKALVNTAPGAVMGTAAYMSPEQARGLKVDARTDIWSVGVILYELITGRRPFKGETSTDTIISVIKKEPKPISNYVADFPSEIEWVVSKTLSKDIDGRYQTAKELHADLTKIKKRVDFGFEKEKSQTQSSDPDDRPFDPNTINLERLQTRLEPVGITNELTAGGSNPEISHPESSLEYAVTKAASHKGITAAIAAVIVTFCALVAYFAFFADPGPVRSIAVMPLTNLTGNKDLKYLSDGISESLIDRLSELPQLKVIARNSSFKFGGKTIDAKDIAAQLGVQALVTGEIKQVGEDLMIRVDVTDVDQDKQLYGETFNTEKRDLLAIQNEIARRVSGKLSLNLTKPQEVRVAHSGTNNAEAYRSYLSGLVELRGPLDVRGEALNHFLKAVELDPDFADAYTEISLIYSSRASNSSNPKELMPKAKEAVQKALSIDDELSKAHVALATVYEYEFNWQGAETEYKRAIELNPNLDFARTRYAFYLSIMNRNSEALEEIRQAELRDPANVRMILLWKSIVLTQARRFDEALRLYQEAEALEPGGSSLQFDLGYVYAGKQEYKKAADAFKDSVKQFGGEGKYSQSLVYLAAAYAKIPERKAEASAIAKRLETTDEYVSPALLAIIYTALDEKTKALDTLDRAYTERDLLLRYVAVGYEYDPLREDPRFKDLLKRAGLPEAGDDSQ